MPTLAVHVQGPAQITSLISLTSILCSETLASVHVHAMEYGWPS